MADLIILSMFILTPIIGFIIGYFLARFFNKKSDKKLMENLLEVLDGKRENSIEIDGKKYDATKFRLRDENGKEILIDLQGGEIKENGEKRSISQEGKEGREVVKEDNSLTRENSRSIREKKRNPRRVSRISRFG